MNTWEKERDELGFIHWLRIDNDLGDGEEYLCKVEKSGGGDYFLCVYREGAAAGGDVLYFNTLAQAKRAAEKMVSSGEWKQMVSRDI